MSADSAPTPLRTPLHALHLRRGARMTTFAGYDMPVHYPAGVLKEHLHTRVAAGLFDVSHMGQIAVVPRAGAMAEAAAALEALLPVDVLGLAPGRQRYGLLTGADGGILDDLMVANLDDRFLLVVNASRKNADADHLRRHLPPDCEVVMLDRALVALQGPLAEAALARIAPDIAAMRFMDVRACEVMGVPAIVSRSGYTGEDGSEIALPGDRVEAVAEALLADPAVLPVGLGARDSLRLEAGLCLYGSDIDETTSPVEAALLWSISAVRRPGGARAGGYPGAERVARELADGVARSRVGLRPEGRAPVRAGTPLFADENASTPVGHVTSGAFGPSLQAPVAMGYVQTRLSDSAQRLFAEVRGQRLPVSVLHGSFVPLRFKRV